MTGRRLFYYIIGVSKIKSAEYWVKFVSSHSHIGKVERRGVKSRVAPGNSATSP